MKSILDNLGRVSASFFPTGDTDIKVSGGFSGMVWLESQTPGEVTWERVPDSLTRAPTQYAIVVNDVTVRYRFNSNLESGNALVFAGGVTQNDDAVEMNAEATLFNTDAATTW